VFCKAPVPQTDHLIGQKPSILGKCGHLALSNFHQYQDVRMHGLTRKTTAFVILAVFLICAGFSGGCVSFIIGNSKADGDQATHHRNNRHPSKNGQAAGNQSGDGCCNIPEVCPSGGQATKNLRQYAASYFIEKTGSVTGRGNDSRVGRSKPICRHLQFELQTKSAPPSLELPLFDMQFSQPRSIEAKRQR